MASGTQQSPKRSRAERNGPGVTHNRRQSRRLWSPHSMMRFSLRKPQAKERKARESDERASKGEQKELKKDRRMETLKRENAIRARGNLKKNQGRQNSGNPWATFYVDYDNDQKRGRARGEAGSRGRRRTRSGKRKKSSVCASPVQEEPAETSVASVLRAFGRYGLGKSFMAT